MKKIVFVIGLIAAFALGAMVFGYMAEPAGKTTSADLGTPPQISAKQAILVDGKTGEVLFEKAADERGYPASTTKIMTALITLDLCRQELRDLLCI